MILERGVLGDFKMLLKTAQIVYRAAECQGQQRHNNTYIS
jgi:hypothetical protein